MQEPFKICFLDIETSPNLGWVWGKWQQNVIEFEAERYLLSFSVLWAGQKRPTTYALPDYPSYAKDPEDDKALTRDLWKVFQEADLIITHNGLQFDIKVSNARFVFHGLKPPSPYKTVDTLKLARQHFKFESNKLDDLGKKLGLGSKVKHTGFDLWKGCMQGDPGSWRLMRRYNAQDVLLLEKLYDRLKPWHATHPNIALKAAGYHQCPVCASDHVQPRGWYYIVARRCHRYLCLDCGKWSRGTYEKIPGTLLK